MPTVHWPGNIRELRNVVERGLSLATGAFVGLAELPVEISGLLPQQFRRRGDSD
jgi:DNA-binding NtrC family response regulator